MDEKDLGLLGRVHELYRAALAEDAGAREWLARRGVTDVDRFQIGFAPGTLKAILPAEGRVKQALRELGLLAGRGRGRETMAGCVTLPLADTSGRVVELAGYSIEGGPRRRAGLDGAVWNWAAMRSHAEVRLLDDPLEAIVSGDETAVAVLEWSDLSERTFRELAPHRVVTANSRFARRLREIGIGEGPRVEPEARTEDGFAATFGRRRYLVQAVSQDNPRHLRALVRAVGATPGRMHLDAFDLYSSRDRAAYVREAALLFGEDVQLVEADLGRLVSLAEEHLRRRLGSSTVELGEDARREAEEILRDPKLLDHVLEDFSKLGIVGEETNRLAGYLVATSRKLADPLSLLVLSRSAAGKSTLAEAVAALMPPEEVMRVTRLTGQALFYGKESLRHKLLVVEEESGVTQAAYALRVLQSAKRLAVATPKGSHEVEGPVAVIVTTTSSELNDETKSRFFVVSVDESREQTRRVLEAQRRREAGEISARDEVFRRHHALQRCLRPVRVVNPYAPQLTFPDHRLSTRREHPKYLGLIRAIAFLRQFQRDEADGEIRVELADIETAHLLADRILGQSLEDLSPPARKLLEAIHAWRPKGTFTRHEIAAKAGWPWTQVWTYVRELSEAEWLIDKGGRPRRYELAWDGREGRVCLALRSIGEIRAIIGRKSGFIGRREKR
jgi:energy-coupling factor transporter ATP-binding protein EcfA2